MRGEGRRGFPHWHRGRHLRDTREERVRAASLAYKASEKERERVAHEIDFSFTPMIPPFVPLSLPACHARQSTATSAPLLPASRLLSLLSARQREGEGVASHTSRAPEPTGAAAAAVRASSLQQRSAGMSSETSRASRIKRNGTTTAALDGHSRPSLARETCTQFKAAAATDPTEGAGTRFPLHTHTHACELSSFSLTSLSFSLYLPLSPVLRPHSLSRELLGRKRNTK